MKNIPRQGITLACFFGLVLGAFIIIVGDKLDNIKINTSEDNITVIEEDVEQISQSAIQSIDDKIKAYIKHKNPRVYPLEIDYIKSSIIFSAEKYNIQKPTMTALIQVESNFDTKANSGQAIGMGQINYSVWKEELKKAGIVQKENDLYDPANNALAIGFVLAKNKENCQKLKDEGKLSAYHFYTVNECMIRRYLGITYINNKPTQTSVDYYNKFRIALADFHLGGY